MGVLPGTLCLRLWVQKRQAKLRLGCPSQFWYWRAWHRCLVAGFQDVGGLQVRVLLRDVPARSREDCCPSTGGRGILWGLCGVLAVKAASSRPGGRLASQHEAPGRWETEERFASGIFQAGTKSKYM